MADLEEGLRQQADGNLESWRLARWIGAQLYNSSGMAKKPVKPEDLLKLPGDVKKAKGWGLLTKKPK